MEQTLRRIELRTRALLDAATGQGRLGKTTIESGQLTGAGRPGSDDFPALSSYFISTLEAHPELSYFGYALEATGEYSVAERKPDGSLEVREYALGADGKMRVLFYVREGDGRRLAREEAWTGYDPRKRPFYAPAKQAGRQVWTDTYACWDTAVAVDGAEVLTGVIDADFDSSSCATSWPTSAASCRGSCSSSKTARAAGAAPSPTRMPTERLVEHLGAFFAAAGEEVEASEGTLDKFMATR